MGKALQLAVDQLVVIGNGPGHIVGVNEDDIEPFTDPPLHAPSVFEQVLVVGGVLGVVLILEVAVGALPVAVEVMIIGEGELVLLGLSADGPHRLVGLLKLVLLGYTELLEEGSVKESIAVLL